MVEAKIRLNIVIPGATMLSKQECLKQLKTKEGTKTVEDFDKVDFHSIKVRDHKNNFKTIKYYTRKCIPAKQSMSLSKEAYDYYISKDSAPADKSRAFWAKLSKKNRLEYHLNLIKESLGGISYTYAILDE